MIAGSSTSPETLPLTVHDVAKMLCCSPRHVYRLRDDNLMRRPLKLGGLNQWTKAAIEKWLADGAPAIAK
jgi:predicted DNA-binding transcriptional regulator AlpA